MSIDRFFNRRYNAHNYNCAHFVCEVWEGLTGVSIAHKFTGLLTPVEDMRAAMSLRSSFERLAGPENPCIVLMQRPRYPSHVGIFIRGRIFHLKETGVEFQPIEIASIGFTKTGYYKC